jgi:hypothetical protein
MFPLTSMIGSGRIDDALATLQLDGRMLDAMASCNDAGSIPRKHATFTYLRNASCHVVRALLNIPRGSTFGRTTRQHPFALSISLLIEMVHQTLKAL